MAIRTHVNKVLGVPCYRTHRLFGMLPVPCLRRTFADIRERPALVDSRDLPHSPVCFVRRAHCGDYVLRNGPLEDGVVLRLVYERLARTDMSRGLIIAGYSRPSTGKKGIYAAGSCFVLGLVDGEGRRRGELEACRYVLSPGFANLGAEEIAEPALEVSDRVAQLITRRRVEERLHGWLNVMVVQLIRSHLDT